MTEDCFCKKKFRTSKPDGSETFSQFSSRLDSYLERWMEHLESTKSYEELKDRIPRDNSYCVVMKNFHFSLRRNVHRISRKWHSSLINLLKPKLLHRLFSHRSHLNSKENNKSIDNTTIVSFNPNCDIYREEHANRERMHR